MFVSCNQNFLQSRSGHVAPYAILENQIELIYIGRDSTPNILKASAYVYHLSFYHFKSLISRTVDHIIFETLNFDCLKDG